MDEDKSNGKNKKGLLDIPFYELFEVSCKFTLNAFFFVAKLEKFSIQKI